MKTLDELLDEGKSLREISKMKKEATKRNRKYKHICNYSECEYDDCGYCWDEAYPADKVDRPCAEETEEEFKRLNNLL